MLIAFDIDGTLCDLTHRLHFIKDGNRDWDAFFETCDQDEPIHEMLTLCNNLIEIGNTVLFASGRSGVCRTKTVEWLNDYIHLSGHGINDRLYMRTTEDRRPDYLVKHDLLVKIMADFGRKPDLVFDDRQQVCDMWRAEGIRCCQVAKGNF